MNFEQILKNLKNALPKYASESEKMVNDLKFLTPLMNESHTYTEEEITAGMASLLQMANEEDVDYKLIENKFRVKKGRVNDISCSLNSYFTVSYPDKRYTKEDLYNSFSEKDIILFPALDILGRFFWDDFVKYAEKKSGVNKKGINMEEKEGKKMITGYLRRKKYPLWIKEEIRRWRKEKISGVFLVNSVDENVVEIFDIPSLIDQYYVITKDVWKELKPGEYIKTGILPWKSYYFFADLVEVLDFHHNGFLIPSELNFNLKKEMIPVLFSAETFSLILATQLEPIYRYLMSSILPTIVAYRLLSVDDINSIINIGIGEDEEDEEEAEEILREYMMNLLVKIDFIFEKKIKNDLLLKEGSILSFFGFVIYFTFLLDVSEIFKIDMTSYLFDIKKVRYESDEYEHYIEKINKKFQNTEKDIAVTLLYLLTLTHSNGEILKKEDWKKAFYDLTPSRVRTLTKNIEQRIEIFKQLIEEYHNIPPELELD